MPVDMKRRVENAGGGDDGERYFNENGGGSRRLLCVLHKKYLFTLSRREREKGERERVAMNSGLEPP